MDNEKGKKEFFRTVKFTLFSISAGIIQAATMIINFVTEYLFQRFIVFGKSIDTAKK